MQNPQIFGTLVPTGTSDQAAQAGHGTRVNGAALLASALRRGWMAVWAQGRSSRRAGAQVQASRQS